MNSRDRSLLGVSLLPSKRSVASVGFVVCSTMMKHGENERERERESAREKVREQKRERERKKNPS